MGKVAKKVALVGRTASTVFGVGLVLALLFGVATTALAGTGVGARFQLGQTNTVNAVTKLVGSVAGPSLVVDNNSAEANATALDLQVEAGKAPMKVNSEGKVANLNSDKLDGQDSGEFAAKAEAPGFDAQTVIDDTPLGVSPQDIATVTVNAPANGFVILTGNGVFETNHALNTQSGVRAYLSQTSGQGPSQNLTYYRVPPSAPAGLYSTPFSITRVFPVSAGEHTFYMTADESGGNAEVVRHNLTAIFIKNQL